MTARSGDVLSTRQHSIVTEEEEEEEEGHILTRLQTIAKVCGPIGYRLRTGFVSSRNAPERRSGPFRHIAAKFRFHLNESDKFAVFGGSKMPSASAGLRPTDQRLCPWTPLGAPPPDPIIGSRSRARHILSVPVLFLTGNEPCLRTILVTKFVT